MKQIDRVLSIQINLNGLSFCILNKKEGQIEHLQDIDFEKTYTPHEILPHLKTELSSKPVFSQDFSEVVVIHQNELATIVPSDFFNENNSADYLKYNSKILKSDYISHDEIEVIDATNVYVPYVNINNYIFDTFGQFTYMHSLSILLNSILKSSGSEDEERVYININQQSFEIAVEKAGTIVLTNVHQYFSKEDFIYFVLFTYEQLGLDPEKNKIILSGRIDKDDELYGILFKYIRHIQFGEPRSRLKLSGDSAKELSKHFLILSSL